MADMPIRQMKPVIIHHDQISAVQDVTGTGGLRLRRKLTENWEVESNLGVESGIDLYYIIELD